MFSGVNEKTVCSSMTLAAQKCPLSSGSGSTGWLRNRCVVIIRFPGLFWETGPMVTGPASDAAGGLVVDVFLVDQGMQSLRVSARRWDNLNAT